MGLPQGLSTGDAAVDGLLEGEVGALQTLIGGVPSTNGRSVASSWSYRIVLAAPSYTVSASVRVFAAVGAAATAAAVAGNSAAGVLYGGNGTDEDEDDDTDTDTDDDNTDAEPPEEDVHGGEGGPPWILW